ncbi:hypothetical protein F7725_011293 [Dissostichus mawsoni]|uniref:Uncharacterized protein n=1 Tax=Dissostichus mawsoni TaxID=36200 RepID=A0A7J5Z8F0_DISMA|nr:hypothetical protein F7725_011293 [Dissostichus mawsoni]
MVWLLSWKRSAWISSWLVACTASASCWALLSPSCISCLIADEPFCCGADPGGAGSPDSAAPCRYSASPPPETPPRPAPAASLTGPPSADEPPRSQQLACTPECRTQGFISQLQFIELLSGGRHLRSQAGSSLSFTVPLPNKSLFSFPRSENLIHMPAVLSGGLGHLLQSLHLHPLIGSCQMLSPELHHLVLEPLHLLRLSAMLHEEGSPSFIEPTQETGIQVLDWKILLHLLIISN